MNILSSVSRLWPAILDASERWEDSVSRLRNDFPDDGRSDAYVLVDHTEEAREQRYRPSRRRRKLGLRGRVKRTAYPPVNLRERRVVIVMHQTGFVASLESAERRARRITAHEVWAEHTVYVVHPDETRLIAANRFDRAPFHALNVEVLGNFAGVEGTGRFFRPEIFGRSEMTPYLRSVGVARLLDRIDGLRERGIEPYMIAPHRVAGRDSRGRPNRQICCGSAIWGIAEEAAATAGVPVPGEHYEIGGLPIPKSWRSEAFTQCRTVDR